MDTFQPDSCCDPKLKCVAYADGGGSSWNALRCVPIARNPDQPGEPCTVVESNVSGIDSCDQGAMCWDVDNNTLEGGVRGAVYRHSQIRVPARHILRHRK